MRKLVFDAIGMYIHLKGHRQIIETESCETLDTTEQEWISEDQKAQFPCSKNSLSEEAFKRCNPKRTTVFEKT